MSAGLIVLVAWLLALASGPQAYDRFNALMSSVPGLILMLIWTQALFYHLLNGIRHLLWDAGWLLDLGKAYASGWAVVMFSLVLTIVVWGSLL